MDNKPVPYYQPSSAQYGQEGTEYTPFWEASDDGNATNTGTSSFLKNTQPIIRTAMKTLIFLAIAIGFYFYGYEPLSKAIGFGELNHDDLFAAAQEMRESLTALGNECNDASSRASELMRQLSEASASLETASDKKVVIEGLVEAWSDSWGDLKGTAAALQQRLDEATQAGEGFYGMAHEMRGAHVVSSELDQATNSLLEASAQNWKSQRDSLQADIIAFSQAVDNSQQYKNALIIWASNETSKADLPMLTDYAKHAEALLKRLKDRTMKQLQDTPNSASTTQSATKPQAVTDPVVSPQAIDSTASIIQHL